MDRGNLYAGLPEKAQAEEALTTLLEREGLRVERIVSTGQATPAGQWYDQPQGEWVVLLQGAATLLFDGETDPRRLEPGDWVWIPPHTRHRVESTAADGATVWLAVHHWEQDEDDDRRLDG